jgi:hypothetical protein
MQCHVSREPGTFENSAIGTPGTTRGRFELYCLVMLKLIARTKRILSQKHKDKNKLYAACTGS